MISNVRIDDRLIHGQVVTMWIPHYKANSVVIVDNKVAKDDVRKSLLRMGCPTEVKLLIWDADTATTKLMNNTNNDLKILILCTNPLEIRQMIKKGLNIKDVTIGNMSFKPGSKSIRKTVFVTEEERECFIEMEEMGVKFISQMIPSEAEDDTILDDIRKG